MQLTYLAVVGTNHGTKNGKVWCQSCRWTGRTCRRYFPSKSSWDKTLCSRYSVCKGSDILNLIPEQHLDLLSACPPCQGFTSLTAKYKGRTLVIYWLTRCYGWLKKPIHQQSWWKMFWISFPGNHLLSPVIERLKKLGYIVNYGVLQVADFGVPQFRKRLVLLAGKDLPSHCLMDHTLRMEERNPNG